MSAVLAGDAVDVSLRGTLGRGALGSFELDVAFSAPGHATTAVFGASGSGKTTLLRSVAGLQRMAGHVRVNGEAWQDDALTTWRAPHQRDVGYVFQEASLFAHLNVRENLMFAHGRAARASLDGVVEQLGLEPLLARAPQALSGGERQRVSLGRALLSRPKLLLMDEPLAALDRAAKDQILPYFERLSAQFSLPILYVSHDIAEVSRLADRVVVLSRGHKVADGAVRDVLERLDLGPATGRFEAHVVVDAVVDSYDAPFCLTNLRVGKQRLQIPGLDLVLGHSARLRIRARDVTLAIERPHAISTRNVLAGEVVDVVEETNTAYAESLIDVGGARLRARLTRKAVHELGLQPGRAVFALIKSVALERGGAARSVGAGTSLLQHQLDEK